MPFLRRILPAGWPWRTLVTATLAALLFLAAGPASDLLVYRHDTLATGQWWRLLSGHLVHADTSHLAWNVGALAVLGFLYEGVLGHRFWACLFTGAVFVDVWLLTWSGLPAYCGLSGVLNTLLVVGLACDWVRLRSRLALLVGAGALIKIMMEMAAGTSLFTSITWSPAPGSHMAGFAAGVVFLILLRSGIMRTEMKMVC